MKGGNFNMEGGNLEFSWDGKEIVVCGTAQGLAKLADLIQRLIDNPKSGHIHLEDYEVLTPHSSRTVIRIV